MKIKKMIPYALLAVIGVGVGVAIAPYVAAKPTPPAYIPQWVPPQPGAGTAEYLYPNVNKSTEDVLSIYQAADVPEASMIYID
jgi:hypothetical protein